MSTDDDDDDDNTVLFSHHFHATERGSIRLVYVDSYVYDYRTASVFHQRISGKMEN